MNVGFQGQSGSNADTAETLLLTQLRHFAVRGLMSSYTAAPARITSGRIEEPLLDLLCGAARKSQMRLQLSMAGKAGAFVGPY
jgi:hypothetical protein